MKASQSQKSALLILSALLLALFTAFALTVGLTYPSVPKEDIAVVRGVDLPPGQLSKKKFWRTFRQIWLSRDLDKAPAKNSIDYEIIKREAIDDLLDRAWLIAEIQERKLELPKKAVSKEFQRIRFNQFPSQEEYKAFLQDSGFNTEEIVERVRLQLFSQSLQVDLVEDLEIPSVEDVQQSYKERPYLYASEDRREYQLLIVPLKRFISIGSKLEELISRVKTVQSFKRLSQIYSAPRESVPGTLPSTVAERLPSYSEGEIGGPVAGGKYIYFFQVTKVIPGATPAISREGIETLRQDIINNITAKARDDFVLDYESKWRAQTFCQKEFMTNRCRNAPKKLNSLGSYTTCLSTIEDRAKIMFLLDQGLSPDKEGEIDVPISYINKVKNENLICPPPVISRNVMPPGGNINATLDQSYLDPFLPQTAAPSSEGGVLPSVLSRRERFYSLDPPAPTDPYQPGFDLQPGIR